MISVLYVIFEREQKKGLQDTVFIANPCNLSGGGNQIRTGE
jgi:hypothetical protein